MSTLNEQFSGLESISFSESAVRANWNDPVSDHFTAILSQAIQTSETNVRNSISFFRNQNGQAIADIEQAYSHVNSHDYSALIDNLSKQVDQI